MSAGSAYSGAFDRLVAALVPYVPQPIVRRLAQPYVAGPTLGDAGRTVRELTAAGLQTTVDGLGESVTDAATASAAADVYLRTQDAIAEQALGATVSLKTSTLGSALGWEVVSSQRERIVHRAEELGSFICIDMEGSHSTDQTLLGVRPNLARMLARDHTVRVYVPYGSDSYAYAQRRLRENPQIAGYVARDVLGTLARSTRRRPAQPPYGGTT